ncbi:MAG: hypothetical protein D3910_13295 [Candidatus Electrothrix sp. ATG2]|nr:hypothetical protein [Candidatus Electrothrix sp. ATG2]
MKTIILILVMILLPVQGYALEFDIWRTGATKKKVMAKAKRNKIELKLETKVLRGSGVASNEIHYNDFIFQEAAQVSLVFTKKTNVLYGIMIDWRDIATTERGDELYKKIGNTLGKKYIHDGEVQGKGTITKKNERFNDCKTTTTKYKGGISLTLFRCQEKRFVSVKYIDSKLEKQNAFEEKNMGRKRDADSGKF